MDRFLTEPGKGALTDAIRDIELQTSAEVVVAVRPSSGRHGEVAWAFGAAAAFLTLALLLFSPWPFGLGWILLDPLLVGAGAGWLTARSRRLRRLGLRRAVAERRMRRAAANTFLENGVHQTRWRTGLLVYISLLERRAVLLGDLGVRSAVAEDDLAATEASIDGALRRGEDAEGVARALAALGPLLGATLERDDDDINELPDEVCAPPLDPGAAP
ncbi:MAG: hypothetical protein AAGF23_11865 [Acidobacteriota bacterium]